MCMLIHVTTYILAVAAEEKESTECTVNSRFTIQIRATLHMKYPATKLSLQWLSTGHNASPNTAMTLHIREALGNAWNASHVTSQLTVRVVCGLQGKINRLCLKSDQMSLWDPELALFKQNLVSSPF